MRWTVIAPVVLAVALAGCASSTEQGTRSSDVAVIAGTTPPSATPIPTTVSDAASATGTSPATTIAPGRTSSLATDGGILPVDFGSTTATVTAADGTTCELCLWLADTADRRADGLMFVTDLGPADGMAFRYPRPHTGTFWMKNTPMPLSIVFYSADGDHLGAFDMEPCLADTCTRYPTPGDFLVAVEVPQGELEDLGFTPGSRLVLHDAPCA